MSPSPTGEVAVARLLERAYRLALQVRDEGLDPDELIDAIDEARALHLRVAGHVPPGPPPVTPAS